MGGYDHISLHTSIRDSKNKVNLQSFLFYVHFFHRHSSKDLKRIKIHPSVFLHLNLHLAIFVPGALKDRQSVWRKHGPLGCVSNACVGVPSFTSCVFFLGLL